MTTDNKLTLASPPIERWTECPECDQSMLKECKLTSRRSAIVTCTNQRCKYAVDYDHRDSTKRYRGSISDNSGGEDDYVFPDWVCPSKHYSLSFEGLNTDRTAAVLICKNIDYKLTRNQFSPGGWTLTGSDEVCGKGVEVPHDKLPAGWIEAFIKEQEANNRPIEYVPPSE